jgi:NDP-sugar pyrophosphorylase family protein
MRDGEELVYEPFQRLIADRQLLTYKYDGFWQCMDTFKEKQRFDDMYARGEVPWEVWRAPAAQRAVPEIASAARLVRGNRVVAYPVDRVRAQTLADATPAEARARG